MTKNKVGLNVYTCLKGTFLRYSRFIVEVKNTFNQGKSVQTAEFNHIQTISSKNGLIDLECYFYS